MDGSYFSNLSFSCPRDAPNKIWATLAQGLQRRSHFEQHWPSGSRGEVIWNSTFFPINMHREANLTFSKKGQMLMYDHYFSYFCRSPVPDDICKDSAKRHPQLWRRRFLKIFNIYWHGDQLGQWTAATLAIFHSPAKIEFEQNWRRGSRGEVIWNS